MEKNYAAWADVFQNARLYLLCGYALPVQTVHIPLHGRHAHAAHGTDDMVVILAVRTAEQRRRDARHGGDLLVAFRDVGNYLVAAEL